MNERPDECPKCGGDNLDYDIDQRYGNPVEICLDCENRWVEDADLPHDPEDGPSYYHRQWEAAHPVIEEPELWTLRR